MALRFTPTSTETLGGNTATHTADNNQREREEEREETGVAQTYYISADMKHSDEELHSGPFISPDSGIPADLLQLTHSFGYDCLRRNNLQLLDEQTLAFIAGNWLVLLDIQKKEQRYLRSCSGGGLGAIVAHPSRTCFALAEKGDKPKIIIYEFPSLHPDFVLRGGTEKAFSALNFNHDGTLLASVGCAPDYTLTLWDLVEKQIQHQCKAFSQDVFRVSLSPYNPSVLTTSGSGHIKFWKMADTMSGPKLSSLLGKFGKTAMSDIDSYLEFPDGKVLSSSEWGNMLLWEGDLIKVEICRKKGQPCHAGPIQQFALDKNDLITAGIDGVIRTWNVESINAADSSDDGGRFEMEPISELIVGDTVRLTSMVKSALPDSSIWFAQDASGSIMKLDLSFSNMTKDPEQLFTFHAGAIQSMDISTNSHLMATTALDRSVRVYDFLAKREVTASQHNQGGTVLTWAPSSISPHRNLLVVGFEDGVVRLLELGLQAGLDPTKAEEAKLCLRQALKPHNAPVTAIAYDRTGEILATGSADHTVFFFTVGEKYEPIGFVTVPGPVRSLEWSSEEHEKNTLLILCRNGHVVEVDAPEAGSHIPTTTFEIQGLPTRHFHFRSIKSRIMRDIEAAQREEREKRRKEKEQMKKPSTEDEDEELEEEEEEEDVATALYIPEIPSPMLCAFYSQPGAFWLSLGGYDAGFLYHCRFSEQQEGDPELRQDEPFAFVPLQDAEEDPVCTVSFSPSRQFFLCGMRSGHLRVYPVPPQEPVVVSLDAFWALSVHDNQNGRLSSVRWSYDEQFVLTAGEDGNIFVFSFHPQEDLSEVREPSHAKIPSPLVEIEDDESVRDILDTSAYSIETTKQRAELDRERCEAENRKKDKRRKLTELQSQLGENLEANQRLPERNRLQPMELELDPRFREEAERRTAEQIQEVQKEQAWETERHRVGLKKLQDRFGDSMQSEIITVVACRSEHKISTYRLLTPSERFLQVQRDDQSGRSQLHEMDLSEEDDTATGRHLKTAERQDETGGETPEPWWKRGHITHTRRKAVEKAEEMKARIKSRKQEWEEFWASKPDEGFEDPEDVRAVQLAKENVGDFKLKTAKDFTVPEQQRMNVDRKTSQLVALEKEIRGRKMKMNEGIAALRDAKIQLISQLGGWMEQLLAVQDQLAPKLRCEPPPLPTLQPEETPERRLHYTPRTLESFAALRSQRKQGDVTERGPEEPSVLSLMEQDSSDPVQTSFTLPGKSAPPEPKPRQRTQLEEEEVEGRDFRLLYQQDCLLTQMEEAIGSFDADLGILRHEKMISDEQIKKANLRHITLFQELHLLKDLEKRENSIQDRLSACMQEQRQNLAKLKDCRKQLVTRQQNLVDLQEREKELHASFQASLGEDNKFADFLTRVFKKKIRREKEKTADEEDEEDSDEDFEDESDWDDVESGEELEGTGPLDLSVCPPSCDPDLFENTLELRAKKAELEDLIAEEKTTCDALKRDCDALAKKEKIVRSNLKTAEGDLEQFEHEKQQKLNELDVVVALRLDQIKILTDGKLPNDLSDYLVLNTGVQLSLQDRIKQLKQENHDREERDRQGGLYRQQLIDDCKEIETRINAAEEHSKDMMISKFGRLVDLDALLTFTEHKTVEELKSESRDKEVQHRDVMNDLKGQVTEVTRILANKRRQHAELLHSVTSLIEEKMNFDKNLNLYKTMKLPLGEQLTDDRWERKERPQRKKSIAARKAEIAALKLEIAALSRKGGFPTPYTSPHRPKED